MMILQEMQGAQRGLQLAKGPQRQRPLPQKKERCFSRQGELSGAREVEALTPSGTQ